MNESFYFTDTKNKANEEEEEQEEDNCYRSAGVDLFHLQIFRGLQQTSSASFRVLSVIALIFLS